MVDTSVDRAEMENSYPHLFDPNLPSWIGCPKIHSTELARQAFQRVCCMDAIITEVVGMKVLSCNNSKPVCSWWVYYKKWNQDCDYEGDISDAPPSELPKGEALKQFFRDITAKCDLINVQVYQKMIQEPDIALVEYIPNICKCYNTSTVEEARENLSNLQIHNM